MNRTFSILTALVVVLGFTFQAQATLILRGPDTLGNQLIYDDDLNITWYDSTIRIDSWGNQMASIQAFAVDFNGTRYTDWRLPTALNQNGTAPCSGFNCTGSEMGHLYYTELGNLSGGPFTTSFRDGLTGMVNNFKNLLPHTYWSSTTAQGQPGNAWYFDTKVGFQTKKNKPTLFPVFIVRSGDVPVTPVPEPATLLLFGSGLVGMFAFRKKIRKNV